MHKRHSQQGIRSFSHGFKGLLGNPARVMRRFDAGEPAGKTKEQV